MTSVTIRDIDDDLTARLLRQATRNGHSIEEEARDILRAALPMDTFDTKNLADAIHGRFARYGGIDLEIPSREAMRASLDFEE